LSDIQPPAKRKGVPIIAAIPAVAAAVTISIWSVATKVIGANVAYADIIPVIANPAIPSFHSSTVLKTCDIMRRDS